MNHQLIKISATVLLAGILGACGGGGSDNSEATKTLVYSGRVTDEGGRPISGIKITLENRETDQFISVTSKDDGVFSAELEAGVYDILFDDPDAEKYVSLQKTAIDLQENRSTEVQIKAASRSSLNIISGSVIAANNSPVAHQKLLAIPFIGRSSYEASDLDSSEIPTSLPKRDLPKSKFIQADANGNFSIAFGSASDAIDVDFDLIALSPDARDFDFSDFENGCALPSKAEEDKCFQNIREYLKEASQEIIDIEKPFGPLHAEVRLGSSTQNLTTSLGLPSITPEATKQLEERKKRIGSKTRSLQTAISNIKKSAVDTLLSLIPSAHAWELTSGYNLEILQDSNRSNGDISIYLHDGHLYNRPHINNSFSMSALANKGPFNNHFQYNNRDDYEYYRDAIDNIIYWDTFTLDKDPNGGRNDQILQLHQNQTYQCTFDFSLDEGKKKFESIRVNSRSVSSYQSQDGRHISTMKLKFENANDRLFAVRCIIPWRPYVLR